MRDQLRYAVVSVMFEVACVRPHLVASHDQGTLAAVLLGQPLLLKWACRYRAVTQEAVLPLIQGLIGLGPCVARGLLDFSIQETCSRTCFAVCFRNKSRVCSKKHQDMHQTYSGMFPESIRVSSLFAQEHLRKVSVFFQICSRIFLEHFRTTSRIITEDNQVMCFCFSNNMLFFF